MPTWILRTTKYGSPKISTHFSWGRHRNILSLKIKFALLNNVYCNFPFTKPHLYVLAAHISNLLRFPHYIVINFPLFFLDVDATFLLFVSLFLPNASLFWILFPLFCPCTLTLQGGFSSPTQSLCWSTILGPIFCSQSVSHLGPAASPNPTMSFHWFTLFFTPCSQLGASFSLCLPQDRTGLSQPWVLPLPPTRELPLPSQCCLELPPSL